MVFLIWETGISVKPSWVAELNWGTTKGCLLYTSDAADERSSVDLGGRRIIKKKKKVEKESWRDSEEKEREKTREARRLHNKRDDHSARVPKQQSESTQRD